MSALFFFGVIGIRACEKITLTFEEPLSSNVKVIFSQALNLQAKGSEQIEEKRHSELSIPLTQILTRA